MTQVGTHKQGRKTASRPRSNADDDGRETKRLTLLLAARPKVAQDTKTLAFLLTVRADFSFGQEENDSLHCKENQSACTRRRSRILVGGQQSFDPRGWA